MLLRKFHLINVAPVSYSLVVEEMLDAIIVLDAWGRIAGVNRAALRLIGRPDKEIVGLPGNVIPSWLRIPEHLSRLEGAAELSYRLDADSRIPRPPTMSGSLASRTAAYRDGWSSSATSPLNHGKRRSGRLGSRPSRPTGPRTHSSPS